MHLPETKTSPQHLGNSTAVPPTHKYTQLSKKAAKAESLLMSMILTTDLLSCLCAYSWLLNHDGQAMGAVVLGLDCQVCEVLDPAV